VRPRLVFIPAPLFIKYAPRAAEPLSGGADVGQPDSQEFMKVSCLALSILGQHVMVITF
jgi:hypothetical protein